MTDQPLPSPEIDPVPVAPTKTSSRNRIVLIGAAVAAAVGVGGYFIASSDDGPKETQIERAAEACGATRNLRDDGETIVFDTEGNEDFSGDTFSTVACVLSELGTPDRVISAMDSTRALDGTLEDSWDEYRARWNYHPDSGMNLTIWIAE